MPVYKDAKTKHWYFVVTHNYKQYKRVKWNGNYMLSKTEATAAEREFLNELELNTENITLYQLFDEYVKTTKSTLKESTQHKYTKFRRNYLVLLPDKPIRELKISDITSFKNEVAKKPLDTTYKNRIQNTLKGLLEYGTIAYDLKGKLQLPLLTPFKDNGVKDIVEKEKWLKSNEFSLLIKDLEINSYWYVVIYTLYHTGLRIGELAALTKDDIFENYLIVNKDYIRVNGVDIVQAPKNKNSVRKVPLDQVTSSMLHEFIKDKPDDKPIFNIKRKFLNQQELRRKINVLQAMAGLEELYITPHTLRHSYSSNLKALGYDEYTISKLMGNTPQVASSTYIHVDLDFDKISKNVEKM